MQVGPDRYVRRKSVKAFTETPLSQTASKKRGRPPALAEAVLEHRRNDLLGVFEACWAEFAWDLQKARTPDAIARALAPLAKSNHSLISSLLARPFHDGRSSQLRKLRREAEKTLDMLLEARKKRDEDSRMMAEAKYAFREAKQKLAAAKNPKEQATYKRTIEEVRGILKERRGSWKASKARLSEIQQKDRTLQELLSDEEATFTQSEVLRFLRSQHYTLTPRNLADALAGMPYVGWRRSFRRCRNLEYDGATSLKYTVFETVKLILTKSHPKFETEAIRAFQELIPKVPKKFVSARDYLKENWADLKAAISDVWRCPTYQRARPYRLTACLIERVERPKTNLERLLASRQAYQTQSRR